MLHRWKMYANVGERRIPRLIDSGNTELACINPDADYYAQKYDPEPIFGYVQAESDLSYRGLYMSVVSTESPTMEGKRWFLRTAYNRQTAYSGNSDPSREIGWHNIKSLQFWNSGFRDYANIYQARSIMNYSAFISRCFGYCFLVGQTFDEDEAELNDFINFYPSLHHYHAQVAINESSIWRPFNDAPAWFTTDYEYDSPDIGEDVELPNMTNVVEAVDGLTRAMEGVEGTLSQPWVDEAANIDLGDLLITDDESED